MAGSPEHVLYGTDKENVVQCVCTRSAVAHTQALYTPQRITHTVGLHRDTLGNIHGILNAYNTVRVVYGRVHSHVQLYTRVYPACRMDTVRKPVTQQKSLNHGYTHTYK